MNCVRPELLGELDGGPAFGIFMTGWLRL